MIILKLSVPCLSFQLALGMNDRIRFIFGLVISICLFFRFPALALCKLLHQFSMFQRNFTFCQVRASSRVVSCCFLQDWVQFKRFYFTYETIDRLLSRLFLVSLAFLAFYSFNFYLYQIVMLQLLKVWFRIYLAFSNTRNFQFYTLKLRLFLAVLT